MVSRRQKLFWRNILEHLLCLLLHSTVITDRPKRRVASVALHTSDVVEIVAKHACKWGLAIEWTSRSLQKRCAAVSLHLATSWDTDACFMVSVAESEKMMNKIVAKTVF